MPARTTKETALLKFVVVVAAIVTASLAHLGWHLQVPFPMEQDRRPQDTSEMHGEGLGLFLVACGAPELDSFDSLALSLVCDFFRKSARLRQVPLVGSVYPEVA